MDTTYHIGDYVMYAGVWGDDAPRHCYITGIGEKYGRTVYDNDLGDWGYENQYVLVDKAYAYF